MRRKRLLKQEQTGLLEHLNDVGSPKFVMVANASVRLHDIVSTQVTPEDEAPGYGIGIGII